MTMNAKVLDLYHQENFPAPDFGIAYRAGIRGVIHKCTEGMHDADPLYMTRESDARAAGLLWGAYHFMRPGDPVKQAETFCSLAHWGKAHTLLVLDHEDPEVRLWAALVWLQTVRKITGQTPWLYSGFLVRQQQDNRHAPVFSEFPLWLAEYGSVAKVPQPWTKYALWQYTDGKAGPEPRSIEGISHPFDLSHFEGTNEELAAAWGVTTPAEAVA